MGKFHIAGGSPDWHKKLVNKIKKENYLQDDAFGDYQEELHSIVMKFRELGFSKDKLVTGMENVLEFIRK